MPELRPIGSDDYRESDACAFCKRRFDKVPFGHHFRTSWGAIDVCLLCAEDLYQTVLADVAGAVFRFTRDIAELRNAVAGLTQKSASRGVSRKRKRSSRA